MHENILILSSDGDFLQLQAYNSRSEFSVKQYNPALKKFVISENPQKDLKEKIIKGDKGDGIPNILSSSDCFVLDKRQTPITKGKLDKFLSEHYSNYESIANTGFTRNQLLIDLSLIPGDIKEKIINTYEETKPAPRSKLLNYFIENRLKNLMDVIEEF